MAMDYILRGVPPKVDPIGPENVLVFAGRPLTGTAISGQSRMSVNCKSPLSGLIGDAQVGRFFPAELKMAGFDAVVVKGKSPFPVYLWIKDGQYELRDASRYWGMGTGTFEDTIQAELGDSKLQTWSPGCFREHPVMLILVSSSMESCTEGRTTRRANLVISLSVGSSSGRTATGKATWRN